MFELLDGYEVTLVTTVTGDKAITITAGDIAEKVGMTPQAVGGILAGLGLRTYPVKAGGKTRKYIIHEEAKLEKLRKRYIPEEENRIEYHNQRNQRNPRNPDENESVPTSLSTNTLGTLGTLEQENPGREVWEI